MKVTGKRKGKSMNKSNVVQIFNHADFGSVKVVEIDSAPIRHDEIFDNLDLLLDIVQELGAERNIKIQLKQENQRKQEGIPKQRSKGNDIKKEDENDKAVFDLIGFDFDTRTFLF